MKLFVKLIILALFGLLAQQGIAWYGNQLAYEKSQSEDKVLRHESFEASKARELEFSQRSGAGSNQ